MYFFNYNKYCICVLFGLDFVVVVVVYRISSSYDLLNHYHLKERPPLLGNLSLAASAQDLYRW